MESPLWQDLSGKIPADFAMKNLSTSCYTPSSKHIIGTPLYNLYYRLLFQKVLSVYKWKIPEQWAENYFLYTLYDWGYIGVFDTWQYGLVAQFPALQGYNMFYQPTTMRIDNQWFENVTRKIGVNGVLVRLMPDYRGVSDIVSRFAQQLALCSQSIDVSLFNSHIADIFAVRDKKIAEDMKKVYDKIASGEPAVFFKKQKDVLNDEESVWDIINLKPKDNYLGNIILSDMRKIENQFNTIFGIPNANTEKKERMVTDEVNSNNVDTCLFSDKMLKNLQKSCKQVNTMFNGDYMAVDWSDSIKEGVEKNGVPNTTMDEQ